MKKFDIIVEKYLDEKKDSKADEKIKQEWMKELLDDYKKYWGENEYKVAKALMDQNNFTKEQISYWPKQELQVKETQDKEYISMGNRASISGTTLSGSIKILGKTYKVDGIPGQSTVRGL